jgi:4'-phosphopantetheinyl transferase
MIQEHVRGHVLADRRLHVWVALPASECGPSSDAVRCAQLELLSSDELQRLERFRTPELQRRYLTTRALVRTVLSRYVPVPPREWVFAASSQGRPLIQHPPDAAASLRFNISHTERLVALLVGWGREVGLDVEQWTRRAPLEVANRFFAASEWQALAGLPPVDRASRFWDYWTLKESYIKARGLGLSIPLDRFSFEFDADDRIMLGVDPVLGDSAGRWQFWQFDLPGQHRMAVCAETTVAGVSDPVAWLTVPTAADQPLPLPCLRRSAGR